MDLQKFINELPIPEDNEENRRHSRRCVIGYCITLIIAFTLIVIFG